MILRAQETTSRRRRMVTAVALVLFAVASIFALIVLRSIDIIKETANRIDDDRATEATLGAVDSLRSQLSGTIHDNATWDGAYKQLNSITRKYWIIDNWATTASSNSLYDTAVVVDVRGKIIVGYKDGKEMTETPSDFFGPDFNQLVAEAYKAPTEGGSVPVNFIRSSDGVALIGAATIRPSSASFSIEDNNLYTLVFARHFSASVISNLSRIFRIDDLALHSERDATRLNVPLRDVAGRDVAYLSWPSQSPGSRSFMEVRTQLAVGCVILVLFLAAIGIVGIIVIRKLREDEAASRLKALRDPLTELWNRAALLEYLNEAAVYPDGSAIQLHLIDLDGFKRVNDTWGHATGDCLIVAVASTLIENLPSGTFIARLGGDEFAAISRSTTDRNLAVVSDAIQQAISCVFEIEGRLIQIGGSVGVAVARDFDADFGELLRTADIALYRAKDLGRGQTVVYDPDLDVKRREDAVLEDQLRRSISKNEIDVFYQPLVRAGLHEICGVEALARWTSPTEGIVSPDVFIPLAEKVGIIDALGLQVLRKAIAAASKWPGIGVCVNVSPIQLQDQGFVREVARAIEQARFEPSRLTLEITEGVLISHPEQAKRAVTGLKHLGVKIALDDFGVGFASIGAMREFGFDRLKIDKSLVSGLDGDSKGPRVLKATVSLATALEIPVTAEGIETASQAAIAHLCGCDVLQGYMFSRPISYEEFTARYFPDTADRIAGCR